MDQDYREVVATVVALAHTLQMKVTVEGIESERQLGQLQALDCDYGQGFYFSKPLTAEEAAKVIKSEPKWLTKPAAA